MISGDIPVLLPSWSAPARVRACSTTRHGGVSEGPYASLNLALHVGDDPVKVGLNRALLHQKLKLADEPYWLNQVHSARCVRVPEAAPEPEADASWTTAPGVVCAVLTADCLPLLICDEQARCVAAVHAGWRGLADGVIEAAVAALPVPADSLLAWLGPAIGPLRYKVGPEVRERFVAGDAEAEGAFLPAATPGKYLADLYTLARLRLRRLGVLRVSGGERCTWSEPADFYSYRRDTPCGRMASLIWLEPEGR